MANNFKVKILVSLITIGILTLFLSTGLLNMTFEKGMPFPEINFGNGTSGIPDKNINSTISIRKLGILILIFIITIGIAISIYKLIRKVNWNDITLVFIYIFGILLILTGVFFVILFFLPHSNTQLKELLMPLPEKERISPLGESPIVFVWILSFILAALISLVIIIIFKSKKQKVHSPHKIELEAIFARNEIQSGKDLKDVIIKCYHKMCMALQDEQELRREESMTVEEFEKRIEAAGAPQKSIHKLTGLFEAVRYGNWKPEPVEEKEAIKCFDDIIEYFSGIRKDDGET